jgi:hypothetical protein
MPMPGLALANDRSFQNIQGVEQCGCSMALITMCLPLRQIRSERQNRLRAVERHWSVAGKYADEIGATTAVPRLALTLLVTLRVV